MLDKIAEVVFLLLAVAGAADLVRWLAHWLMRSGIPGKLFLVLPVHGHEEGAEMMLTGAVEKLQWLTGKDKKVVCVNCGMDEETETVCRILAARNPCIEICTPEELPAILEY